MYTVIILAFVVAIVLALIALSTSSALLCVFSGLIVLVGALFWLSAGRAERDAAEERRHKELIEEIRKK